MARSPVKRGDAQVLPAAQYEAAASAMQDQADASQLRALLNLPGRSAFCLLLTWLSFAEFVRTAVDPNEVPLVGMPRREDLPAYAKNNAILYLPRDNASTPSHTSWSQSPKINRER
jgi:hypothetical protein